MSLNLLNPAKKTVLTRFIIQSGAIKQLRRTSSEDVKVLKDVIINFFFPVDRVHGIAALLGPVLRPRRWTLRLRLLSALARRAGLPTSLRRFHRRRLRDETFRKPNTRL